MKILASCLCTSFIIDKNHSKKEMKLLDDPRYIAYLVKEKINSRKEITIFFIINNNESAIRGYRHLKCKIENVKTYAWTDNKLLMTKISGKEYEIILMEDKTLTNFQSIFNENLAILSIQNTDNSIVKTPRYKTRLSSLTDSSDAEQEYDHHADNISRSSDDKETSSNHRPPPILPNLSKPGQLYTKNNKTKPLKSFDGINAGDMQPAPPSLADIKNVIGKMSEKWKNEKDLNEEIFQSSQVEQHKLSNPNVYQNLIKPPLLTHTTHAACLNKGVLPPPTIIPPKDLLFGKKARTNKQETTPNCGLIKPNSETYLNKDVLPPPTIISPKDSSLEKKARANKQETSPKCTCGLIKPNCETNLNRGVLPPPSIIPPKDSSLEKKARKKNQEATPKCTCGLIKPNSESGITNTTINVNVNIFLMTSNHPIQHHNCTIVGKILLPK